MSHIFKSYIGVDTEVSVEFDYTPQSPAVLYPVEKSHPEELENCVVTAVYIGGEDILSELNESSIERLTEKAFDYVYARKRDAFDADPLGE